MPVANYRDWTAPVCQLVSSSRSWVPGDAPNTVTSYSITYFVTCNENASLHVVASSPVKDKKDQGTSSTALDITAAATVQTTIGPIDLVALGFPVGASKQWLKITATDAAGNADQFAFFQRLTALSL